jgi:hypothetical protein
MTELPLGDPRETRQMPSYEEMLEMKALGQQKMEVLRRDWRMRNAAMTMSERRDAEERFSRAAVKISAQFSKSRRLVLDLDSGPGSEQ